MIASSRIGMAAALLLAGGAHGALLLGLAGGEGAGGGATGQQAAPGIAGAAFSDFAMPLQAAQVVAMMPQSAPPAPPAAMMAPAPAHRADAAAAASLSDSAPLPVPAMRQAVPAKVSDTAVPALKMAVADSLLADPAKARSVTEQPPRVAVTARRDSARPPQQQARPAQAEQRETLAPDISERPRARADASSPQLDPVPKIAAAQPDGGQARPPGLPQAAASGPARHAGTGPGKEATAYPDAVMRRLSKAARPRVGLRGEAVIAFEVAADGSLAHASVARSSGAPALDSAALAFVRGAAPFPPPPDGAQRSFSIRIAGR